MHSDGIHGPGDRLRAFTLRCWRVLQQYRKAVATVLIIGIAAMTATFTWWFLSGPKYTVAECLTGIQIHFPESMPEKERIAILEQIFKFGGTNIFRDGGPVSSASVDENDIGRWYFLYRDNCDKKHEMVQDFIDAFLLVHPSDSIEIEVIREPVRPTHYNAGYGDYWIDGHKIRPAE